MSKKLKKNKARMPTNAPKITRQFLNTGYSETGANLFKGSISKWVPQRASAKSDIDENLSVLRGRSSNLWMGGSAIARAAISNSRQNVIGSGLHVSPRPKYRLLGISPEAAEEWALTAKEEFDMWANSTFCDSYKRNNFYDMQDIAYVSYMVDGDSFAAIKHDNPMPFMPYTLRIQLLEATRICNPYEYSQRGTSYGVNPDTGNRIISGVEIDDNGAVVAYWVCNKYPNDHTDYKILTNWVRVQAVGKQTGFPNILQIGHDERIEQYRGVPYLAPVIELMKQVGRYTDAELTTAIIKSFFTLFFTQSQPHSADFPLSGLKVSPGGDQVAPSSVNDLKSADIELGPGTLNALPENWDVKSVDANKNLSTFEPFTKELIKEIGAALGQPYEVLMKAFNSSYTAGRAALLQAWADFRMRRTWFTRDFCQPIYEIWLTEAVISGRVKAPGFFDDPLKRKAWCNSEWYGPVMGILDPVKEVQAAGERVLYGFSTRDKECAELTGTTFSENTERISIENARLKEEGQPVYPEATLNEEPDSKTTSDTEEKGDEA